IQLDAAPGPSNWMNSVFAIGLPPMYERKIMIDAYSVTNLEGEEPRGNRL
ncbi:hypothetical protein DOTSEDRAFT_131671, partial [Dothistroma septosporum NZE10]